MTTCFLTLDTPPGRELLGHLTTGFNHLRNCQAGFQGRGAISIPMLRKPLSRKLRGLRVHGAIFPIPPYSFSVSFHETVRYIFSSGALTVRLLSFHLRTANKVWALTWGQAVSFEILEALSKQARATWASRTGPQDLSQVSQKLAGTHGCTPPLQQHPPTHTHTVFSSIKGQVNPIHTGGR